MRANPSTGRSLGAATVVGALPLAVLLQAAPDASAQPYPAKSMHLVVGVPPGGAADFTARVISQQVQDALGQSMLVDNRPGAGGTLASETVARASADGYTLLLSSSSTHGVAPALYRKLGWDAQKDFTHVALINTIPGVMAVHQAVPTMAESGHPGLEGGLWYGVSGPARLDPAVVEVLAREVVKAASSADTRERFASVGAFSTPLGPREYTAFIARELAKWGEVIRASGARID